MTPQKLIVNARCHDNQNMTPDLARGEGRKSQDLSNEAQSLELKSLIPVSEFDYELPTDLIAQQPAVPRGNSRLLVVNRSTGDISHHWFEDLPEIFTAPVLFVVNDTKVIPARLLGTKNGGGKVEVFLLREVSPRQWRVLLKPARRIPIGTVIKFEDEIIQGKVLAKEAGFGMIEFQGDDSFEQFLHRKGRVPLPPYIKRDSESAEGSDRESYQTVYARKPGAVAAPTAGLHFTARIIENLQARGNAFASLTLHVGYGTFKPVDVAYVQDWRVDAEWFEVSSQAATTINSWKQDQSQVVAVGTTSVRVLETSLDDTGTVHAGQDFTDLFIYPGYTFRSVDHLLTNFHLPRSSLLMLVSAFGGNELILKAYHEAVTHRYRFYSYGDAMLIL